MLFMSEDSKILMLSLLFDMAGALRTENEFLKSMDLDKMLND